MVEARFAFPFLGWQGALFCLCDHHLISDLFAVFSQTIKNLIKIKHFLPQAQRAVSSHLLFFFWHRWFPPFLCLRDPSNQQHSQKKVRFLLIACRSQAKIVIAKPLIFSSLYVTLVFINTKWIRSSTDLELMSWSLTTMRLTPELPSPLHSVILSTLGCLALERQLGSPLLKRRLKA